MGYIIVILIISRLQLRGCTILTRTKRKLYLVSTMSKIMMIDLSHSENIIVVTKIIFKRARYHLAPPTPVVTEVKLRQVQANLLNDVEAKSDLIKVFKMKMLHGGTVKHVSSGLGKTVCQIAARKLVNKVLQSRKISA